MVQTLLAIRQLEGPHTGENQAEIIIQVIEDYGIGASTTSPQIGYFVTDNATNNDTAIDIVLLHFFPQMHPKTRRTRRLRCLGHVINLAAKAFLYGQDYDAFQRDIEAVQDNSELLKELKLWRNEVLSANFIISSFSSAVHPKGVLNSTTWRPPNRRPLITSGSLLITLRAEIRYIL